MEEMFLGDPPSWKSIMEHAFKSLKGNSTDIAREGKSAGIEVEAQVVAIHRVMKIQVGNSRR